jgi:hypothetical protein
MPRRTVKTKIRRTGAGLGFGVGRERGLDTKAGSSSPTLKLFFFFFLFSELKFESKEPRQIIKTGFKTAFKL